MQDARARQRALLDLPQDQGLYSFRNEHDACGVGLVAHLDNQASHAIIANGLTVLKRLMHRGAAGGDPETGDGAGLLFAIPDKFFRKQLGAKLPAPGRYGVAMVFGGEDAEADLERIAASEGLGVIAWREVPTDPASIGRTARESCPRIRQLFLDGSSLPDPAALERQVPNGREQPVPDGVACTPDRRGGPRGGGCHDRYSSTIALAAPGRVGPGHHPGHPTARRVAAQQTGVWHWDS